MSDFSQNKWNPGPCGDEESSQEQTFTDLNDSKLLYSIPQQCLKASTTMQEIVCDSDQENRIRELIRKLKKQ